MIDVDAALRDLAAHAEASDVDVATAVRARIREERWPARPRRWRWAAAAAAVVAGVLAIIPGTRTAIADWFGLRGVDVRFEDRSLPTVPPAEPLELGEPIPMASAASRLGHPPLVAPAQPDSVYADGRTVTLRYGPLLLSEFAGGTDEPFVLKRLVPADATIRDVTVNGGHGLWIEGPHTVGFASRAPRLAASTLLWEQGPITLRLEGAGSLDAALAFAGTLRPVAV